MILTNLRSSLFAVSLFVVVALSGCGPATLTKAAVEKGAMDALTAAVGMPSPQVTCPSDMPAVVGGTMVCAMTLTAGTYDVTVTITEVDSSGTAKFNVVTATMPRP